LFLRPDGKVEGLYHDILPTLDLGKLSVRRASNVEFNNITQEWEVINPDNNHVLAIATTREAAIKHEVWLLNMLMECPNLGDAIKEAM